jgi:single-strand DNA-binding protein
MRADMSDGINTVMLFGFLGADAEVKQTAKGDSFLRMRLATTRSWTKENNEKEERTDWHTLVYFKRGESLAKHLTKGTRIFVQGRIETSSYEKDGQKKYSTSVIVEELTFAGAKPGLAAASPGDFPPALMPKAAARGMNGRDSSDRGKLSDLPF